MLFLLLLAFLFCSLVLHKIAVCAAALPLSVYSPLAAFELGPKIAATPLSMRSHAESEEFSSSEYVPIPLLLSALTMFLQHNAAIFRLESFDQGIQCERGVRIGSVDGADHTQEFLLQLQFVVIEKGTCAGKRTEGVTFHLCLAVLLLLLLLPMLICCCRLLRTSNALHMHQTHQTNAIPCRILAQVGIFSVFRTRENQKRRKPTTIRLNFPAQIFPNYVANVLSATRELKSFFHHLSQFPHLPHFVCGDRRSMERAWRGSAVEQKLCGKASGKEHCQVG